MVRHWFAGHTGNFRAQWAGVGNSPKTIRVSGTMAVQRAVSSREDENENENENDNGL